MSVSRSRWRVMLCVLVGLLCLSLPGLFQAQSEQGAVVLLTEEEAARLRLTEEQFEWQVEYQRGTLSHDDSVPQPGPRIDFQSPAITEPPSVVEATTPFSLLVAFRSNRAPVDMQSLRVRAGKLGIWWDLTERLGCRVASDGDGGCRMESDGDGGWCIVAERVEVPRGRFRIEITIADQERNETQGMYFLRVRRS